MQLNITKTKIIGFCRSAFMVFILISLITGKINAQTYSNGPLSTGPTSSNGIAAPAGSTWSEVQNPNTNAGFGANITAGLTVADNFTVCGSWNVTKVTFYAYSTGFAGATSPFTDVRVQIYNTDPSVGSPAPIFGNLTTNRFLASSFANMYRIFNATTGTTRRIWAVEATVNTTLASGNYWIEWQLGNGGLSNFSPAVTIVGAATQPGWNAKQRTLPNTWVNLVDGSNPQDMPFLIDYTSAACTGTPAPGNTIASATSVCPGTPVALSLQACSPGTGVTYQWQSAPTVGGPYTNITGATNATYSTTITATTFFQAVVTCSGNPGTSTPVQVTLNAPSACYCTAGATSTAFEKISRFTLNTIINSSTSTAGYENFTALSTILEPGRPYPLTVSVSQPFASDQVIVWIDYNQNGVFTDAGEAIYVSPAGFPSATNPSTVSGNIIVPFTALPGSTRMRVRLHDTAAGPNATSCGTSTFGQVEDYTVTILPVVACAGTPAPGNTVSSVPTVCTATNFTLSLQNFTSGSGVTYQWQSSATGAPGSYTNIAGATSVLLTRSQTAATYYQAIVTCGANSATSTPIQVLLTAFTGCYCTPPSSNCNLDDRISNVTFGSTLNNNSACSANGYANYRTTIPATDIVIGAPNPMRVTVGPGGTEFVAVWIDYNQNAVFEASEYTLLGSGNGSTITNNVNVPATALLGVTGMRVRVNWNSTITGAQACTALGAGFGETEDYLVNIIPCVQGVINTQPVNRTIACGGNTTFSIAATGSLLNYKWEYRVNATSPWLFVPNTGVYSGAGTNTLTITNAPESISGYQYRVVIDGACTATEISNVVSLTVTKLVATVTPAASTICLGTIQPLSITNSASLSTTSFCSGPVNIQIPDRIGPPASSVAVTDAGINHTIPVTLPAGSIISSMNVKLNIAHSYVGDLVIVLKAPNGKILNLDYHKSGTGSAGANFTNTVISSLGTAAISSGTPPYTGTFRADASIGAGTFGDPSGSGPTAFQPDVTTFAALYSVPSGNWTIAIQDPSTWGGDIGVLNDWCVEFTYGAPSTGVFSGPASTIFTDPAGTIPYTGTAVTTVYVKPLVTSNYTVVVTNSTCVSGVTTIPITVNVPITGTSTVTNKTVCVGGNTSFTASAPTTGSPVLHQWKVSTDAGVTFTNVANGGVYSGATTATLNITSAMLSMNGYRYKDSLYVNVCNSFVNTNVATLTVNPNPVITISANPLTALYPGQTTTLTAAVSPNAAATYTWFRNGVAVPGATASTLVLDVDDLGVYTVNVTDVNGCSGSSASIEIKDAPNDILFIYPSPNTGQFQVRYYSLPGNSTLPRMVNVYDSKGARVFTKSYSVTLPYTRLDVDMSHYNSGIYMVELTDVNGRRLKTGRVLIQ